MKNDLPAGIEEFLTHYGDALTAGDLGEIVQCWAVPALVLSDHGSVAVTERRQVRDFFERAIEGYRSEGIVKTRHHLEHCETLSDSLVSVDVAWLALDALEKDHFTEHTRYVLAAGATGFQIRVAITTAPVATAV